MSSLSLYDVTITPMLRNLNILSTILAQGSSHPKASTLIEHRLIEDMKPLAFQVQVLSNSAKFLAVRVANHPPSASAWPDTETTWEELQTRITTTIDYLKGVSREEFDGAQDREFEYRDIKWTGLKYVNEFAMPNFYFHFVTAYNILRSGGVDVGKFDYLGVPHLKKKD